MKSEELKRAIDHLMLSVTGGDSAKVIHDLQPNTALSIEIHSALNDLKLAGKSQNNWHIYKLLGSLCDVKPMGNCLPIIIQFIPCIIWNYLISVALQNNEQSYIVPCLLRLYNEVVIDNKSIAHLSLFKMPNVATPSIYNQSAIEKVTTLTQSALQKHDTSHSAMVSSEQYCIYDQINASNRSTILHLILSLYNEVIIEMPDYSRVSYCQMCSRIALSGIKDDSMCDRPDINYMTSNNRKILAKLPRIYVDSKIVNDMISGLLYAMHNGQDEVAKIALKHLHFRSSTELMLDSLLISNAALHLIKEATVLESSQSEAELSHHSDMIKTRTSHFEDSHDDDIDNDSYCNDVIDGSNKLNRSLEKIHESNNYSAKARSLEALTTTEKAAAGADQKATQKRKPAAVSVDNINITLEATKKIFRLQQDKWKSDPFVCYSEEKEV